MGIPAGYMWPTVDFPINFLTFQIFLRSCDVPFCSPGTMGGSFLFATFCGRAARGAAIHLAHRFFDWERPICLARGRKDPGSPCEHGLSTPTFIRLSDRGADVSLVHHLFEWGNPPYSPVNLSLRFPLWKGPFHSDICLSIHTVGG